VRIEVPHGPDELVWVVVDPLVPLALHRDDRRAGNSGGDGGAASRRKLGCRDRSAFGHAEMRCHT
jgi:hypothetical protein